MTLLSLKLPGSEPVGPVGGFIQGKVFTEHENLFPQVTVDIVVVSGRSFLLVRRSSKNSTGQGIWATVGGRIRKNETLEAGAVRILERETGMRVDQSQLRFLGVNQYFDERVHCVSIVFRVRARSRSVVLDETSSDYGWFTPETCPPSLIPHYKSMLSLGGLHLPLRARGA